MRGLVISVTLFVAIDAFTVPPDITLEKKNSHSDEQSAQAKNLDIKDKMNDTELYNENTDGKLNVSQRSSVYISKKFRKQFRNHMYKVLVPRVDYYQNHIVDKTSFMNSINRITTHGSKKPFPPNVPNVLSNQNIKNENKTPNVPNVHDFQNVENIPNIPNAQNVNKGTNIPIIPNVNNFQNVQNIPNAQNVNISNVPNNSKVSYNQNVPNMYQQNYPHRQFNYPERPLYLPVQRKHNDQENTLTRSSVIPELKSANSQKEPEHNIARPIEYLEMVRPYNSTISKVDSNPGIRTKNKGRITSLTNRKVNNIKCSFPDPHLLHRSSFSNRPAVIKTKLNRNRLNEERNNYDNNRWLNRHNDINFDNISGLSDEDEKIDKYIKEALEDKEKYDDINTYIKMLKNNQNNNQYSSNMKGQLIDFKK